MKLSETVCQVPWRKLDCQCCKCCNNLFISFSCNKTQKHKENWEAGKNTKLMEIPTINVGARVLFLASWVMIQAVKWSENLPLSWTPATPTPWTAAGSRPTARGGPLDPPSGTTRPATTPPGTRHPLRRPPRPGDPTIYSCWLQARKFPFHSHHGEKIHVEKSESSDVQRWMYFGI